MTHTKKLRTTPSAEQIAANLCPADAMFAAGRGVAKILQALVMSD
jgi:hypothetical protein